MLCLITPSLAQGTLTFYPVKMGRLAPGDKLSIRIIKEANFGRNFASAYVMDLRLNVVIRHDNKLGRIIRGIGPDDNRVSVPLELPRLSDLQAAGLTVSELRELLVQQYAEKDVDTRVTVQFTGSGNRK
jgi:protein involved in polysaccharide export with SLBB domain